MIKYQLICNDCNLIFDSWFASSKEFEKLKKKKLLNCHKCNSLQIEKSLMKPNVLNRDKVQKEFLSKENNLSIKKTIKEYQNFIKKNFDYVGIILLMKQEVFIMIKEKEIKVFLERHLRKI